MSGSAVCKTVYGGSNPPGTSTITLKPLKVKHFQGFVFYGDRFGDYLKIIVPAGCSRQFLHYGMVQ